MITIQNQNFGVEIELTGITRQAAAQVIADYYGTIGTRFMGTVYKTYEAVDNKGRRWKCMRDASITPQRRVNGHVVDVRQPMNLMRNICRVWSFSMVDMLKNSFL